MGQVGLVPCSEFHQTEIKVLAGAANSSEVWGPLPRSLVADGIHFLAFAFSCWLPTGGNPRLLKAPCPPRPCGPLHNMAVLEGHSSRPAAESLSSFC